jgi:hypothetical protein
LIKQKSIDKALSSYGLNPTDYHRIMPKSEFFSNLKAGDLFPPIGQSAVE